MKLGVMNVEFGYYFGNLFTDSDLFDFHPPLMLQVIRSKVGSLLCIFLACILIQFACFQLIFLRHVKVPTFEALTVDSVIVLHGTVIEPRRMTASSHHNRYTRMASRPGATICYSS
jgi:hypothetical protein